MPRREEEEEHQGNSERWMLTYLDMITLLMIFFLVLYSISTVNQQKFSALAEKLGMGLGGSTYAVPDRIFDNSLPPKAGVDDEEGSGSENAIDGLTGEQSGKPKTLEQVQKEIQALIEKENIGQFVTDNLDERGVVISMREALLFELGSAEINGSSIEVLKKIAVIISQTSNYIRIEGFTDDLPIHTPKYASNWELASQRAVNVTSVLINSGLNPSMASAMSYGEYRPVVPNTSEENRKLNRRVDIVVINKEFDKLEPGSLN